MMDRPLLLKQFLWRAERVHAAKQVIVPEDGELRSCTYREYGGRVRRLASALGRLGVSAGDRVGTLGWNTLPHFDAYFAVPCMGAVLHTINFRLFPDQVAFIVNHAGDRVLMLDSDQLPLVEQIADELRSVEAFVLLTGDSERSSVGGRPLLRYDELVDSADEPDVAFPDLDENAAAGLCYTSATTGDPKGVLYSHRSMVLHSLAHSLHGSFGVRESMRVLVVSPMFHSNAWGVPHAAAVQGATLILPGAHPDARAIVELVEATRATHLTAAVTVGIMIRDFIEQAESLPDISSLQTLWLGGQAPPEPLIRWFDERCGIEVTQGWGMTEASPLVTFNAIKSTLADRGRESLYELRTRQGLPAPCVEIEVVDDAGKPLPWDGESVGEYRIRAPWVASAYFNDPARTAEAFVDGWFMTGDVGVIDRDGYLRLVDRSRDLIKSGGEWISSVDLESALMGHPGVREAAVIAVPDEKWLERPLACIVPNDAHEPPSDADLRGLLAQRFARWWIPDRYEFLDEIPKTGVGKTDKKALRNRFAARAGATGSAPAEP